MCLECLEGLAELASVVSFIFTGISFGRISVKGCVKSWEVNPQLFCLRFARGYSYLGLIFFIVQAVVSGYFAFYDVFIILISFGAILAGIATLAMIAKDFEKWVVALFVQGLIVTVKMPHTVYFLISLIYQQDEGSPRFIFLICCLVMELILLLFWTLLAYLPFTATDVCLRCM